MKRLLLVALISFLLSACGGGGGGGGGGSSAPAAITYTYDKISAAGVGSTFDEVTTALLHQPGYYYWVDGGSNILDLSIDSDLNPVVKFDTTSIFSADSQGSLRWEVIDDSSAQPAFNVLDDYAAWTEVSGTVKDLIELTEVGYRLEGYSFFIETGSVFLGTEYVFPMILFNDHGSDNQYGVGGGSDSLTQLEVIATVFGDKTEFGDMPGSGSSDYSSKAIATAHLGWSGNSWAYNSREIKYVMGVESDSTLLVNHDAGTVSGTVLLDYVFNKSMFAGEERPGLSLGSVSFEGKISDRNVDGTATWGGDNGEGTFSGSFYGPNGDEFGGVVRLVHRVETASGDLDGIDFIVASIVASK